MIKTNRFEDLEVWKESRVLCQRIYAAILGSKEFARSWALRGQIDRSSGSIMDNIAEGHGRGGNAEFRQFLYYSKGSAAETRSQLWRAYDRQFLTEEEFKSLYEQADRIGAMLGRFLQHINQSSFKGIKYK